MRTSIIAIALTILVCDVRAQNVRMIDELLQREVDQEHVAGAVVQVARHGEILHRAAYGFARRYVAEPSEARAPHGSDGVSFDVVPVEPPEPMTSDHLFDLASLTKVFATTFGIMLLVDRGLVDLDAPVREYLPEFTGDGKDLVTVRLLLTHTGGLAQWYPVYYEASTKSESCLVVLRRPLEFEVGSSRRYSDLGFMLLGYLIERVTGEYLDVFLARNLYEPLGLQNTTFRPLEHGIEPARIAATSHGNPFEWRMVHDDAFGYRVDVDPHAWDGWRRYTLRGEVNDGNAFHAGLFSTVDDLQKLIALLLAEGRHGEETLIRADVVRAFLSEDAFGNGLGWAMAPDVIQATGAPEGTFGHTGFTGTSVVVMPDYGLSIILLTNRQNVGVDDAGNYYNLNPTRRRLVDVVLRSVDR